MEAKPSLNSVYLLSGVKQTASLLALDSDLSC